MKKNQVTTLLTVAIAACFGLHESPANAALMKTVIDVEGTDAIFLAGREDVEIPPLGNNFELLRHGFPTSNLPEDFRQERFPQSIPVSFGPSGEFRATFKATGCVNFFIGAGCEQGAGIDGFGPNGGPAASDLRPLEGISGYRGPQGALVGLFWDDSNPLNTAPPDPEIRDLDRRQFFPELGQIFLIGDGMFNPELPNIFSAPSGATRLFLGIADGFGFVGSPGAYEDNDGSYRVEVTYEVPEPTTTLLVSALVLGGGNILKRKLGKKPYSA